MGKLFAQETLIFPNVNPQIKFFQSENSAEKKDLFIVDTLNLPFFDDFSNTYPYPNQKFWADKKAYINSYLPDKAISVGVATLDAVDENGILYSQASYGNLFTADFLTSKPINLYFPDDESIYLSFYYQPQGLGDAPEGQDSLLLDFFSPLTKEWKTVWQVSGTTNQEFKQAMIHITDTLYLQKGFQFRFKNFCSLSGSTSPSMVGNADFWHIDYVYLNKNRNQNDINPKDVAFIEPLQSLLEEYESIPYLHFRDNSDVKMRKTIDVTFRNNDNARKTIDSLKYIFKNLRNNSKVDTLFAGSHQINKNQISKYQAQSFYRFPTLPQDSAIFQVEAKFVTDEDDSTINNSIFYQQKFFNYYAYDDGSAESGYGLTGEGTQNAMCAYKFFTFKPDTLWAVQIYFNQTLNKASWKPFHITIWNSKGQGIPAQRIFKQEGQRPIYEKELNRYHTYVLDTALFISDTFYIGWTQTSIDMLNVGFDINRQPKEKIYYNISGEWQVSKKKGALMIRPILGKRYFPPTNIPQNNEISEIKVFPNPASDKIFISTIFENKIIELNIFDLYGRKIQQHFLNDSETQISISHLKNGLYFLRFSLPNGKVKTLKFLKL